jgi:hypothetical protein
MTQEFQSSVHGMPTAQESRSVNPSTGTYNLSGCKSGTDLTMQSGPEGISMGQLKLPSYAESKNLRPLSEDAYAEKYRGCKSPRCLVCGDRGIRIRVGPDAFPVRVVLMTKDTTSFVRPCLPKYLGELTEKQAIEESLKGYLCAEHMIQARNEGALSAEGDGAIHCIVADGPFVYIISMPRTERTNSTIATNSSLCGTPSTLETSIRDNGFLPQSDSEDESVLTTVTWPVDKRWDDWLERVLSLEPIRFAEGPTDKFRCALCDKEGSNLRDAKTRKDLPDGHNASQLFALPYNLSKKEWMKPYRPKDDPSSLKNQISMRSCKEHKEVLKDMVDKVRKWETACTPHGVLEDLIVHIMDRVGIKDSLQDRQ